MHRMAEQFKDTQYAFAAHIRDPENQPAPDNIESRRMAIYRELFFNNINSTLQNAFPVIRTLYSDEQWLSLVRDFMVKHHCKTPLFVEIAREFIEFLEQERQTESDPAFVAELAHYEWVELALGIADAEFTLTPLNKDDDILTTCFERSPLAWLLVYQYPVHQISKESQPNQPGNVPTCLLVQRNASDEISFIELNPVSAKLMDWLSQGETGETAVAAIAEEMQHPEPHVVAEGARQMIQDWVDRGILLKTASR
jgi:hypothetical protein